MPTANFIQAASHVSALEGRARRAILASRRLYRQGGSACLDASPTNQFILNVASLYDTGLK
jgi:hypothetical protein